MAFMHVHFDKTLVTLQSSAIEKNVYLDLAQKAKSKMKAIEAFKKLDSAAIEKLKSKNILTW
jgi:hypothetical protein